MTPRRTFPGVVIRTAYNPKPGDWRGWHDWDAWDDANYCGEPGDPFGYGACEADAIDDLISQLEERET